jgi:hypothetical protein
VRRLLPLLILPLLLTACHGGPPPAEGYGSTLPVGAALPSEQTCSERVHRSSWEPRPGNAEENQTMPPTNFVLNGYGGMSSSVWQRVSGRFTGTTDEIAQWAACKWGIADNVLRASMVVESSWRMSQTGDAGDCDPDPSSLGLTQIKWCMHPGTHYWAPRSSAFNTDYWGAVVRGCMDGDDYVQGGELWGCIGRWYSGDWYSAGARTYIGWVQDALADKAWRGW